MKRFGSMLWATWLWPASVATSAPAETVWSWWAVGYTDESLRSPASMRVGTLGRAAGGDPGFPDRHEAEVLESNTSATHRHKFKLPAVRCGTWFRYLVCFRR